MIKGLSALEINKVGAACNDLAIKIQYFTQGQVQGQAVHRADMPGLVLWAFWVIRQDRVFKRVIGTSTDPYNALLDLAQRLDILVPEMPEEVQR